jgi:hypothetical protein
LLCSSLQVVVVGLSLLVVEEVAGVDFLGSIRSPQSIAARKDKELECDVLYFYISFVLTHGREFAEQ